MQENSIPGQPEGVKAPEWLARRKVLQSSTAYWSLLEELSASGGFDHAFADEAATAILCLLEQQMHLQAGGSTDIELPEKLGELVLGCGGLQRSKRLLDPDDFVFNVADALSVAEERARVLVRAVFTAVRQRLTTTEVIAVGKRVPPSLRSLWAAL